MQKFFEEIRKNLSKSQRNKLVRKINNSNLFRFTPLFKNKTRESLSGWVDISEENSDPVGFIGEDSEGFYLELVNINLKFPKDYHSELREIYLDV